MVHSVSYKVFIVCNVYTAMAGRDIIQLGCTYVFALLPLGCVFVHLFVYMFLCLCSILFHPYIVQLWFGPKVLSICRVDTLSKVITRLAGCSPTLIMAYLGILSGLAAVVAMY